MLYEAALLLCMVSPLGAEYCTPAAPKLSFPTQELCQKFIDREREHLKTEANLEMFRVYLPSMKEGKLQMKWACSTPIEREWLGRDLPKVKGVLEDEILSKDGAN